MCKECRNTETGKAIWEEYLAAQSAAMKLTGGGYVRDREAVAERWRKAKEVFQKHHDDFVINGMREAVKAGAQLTVFACRRNT